MGAGKMKASKFKVHVPPEGPAGLDGPFHVYVYDVVQRSFYVGKSFDTVERAVSFLRHEQERIYNEQEAAPELFDLPFVSSDPDLLARTERDPAYKEQLIKELQAELRSRERMR
jgi:hypothetical protein